jgi:hypothetical protein
MKTTISIISFFETVCDLATGRLAASIALTLVAGGCLLTGCGPAMTRPELERQKLLTTRKAADEQATTTGQKIIVRLLERTKAEYDKRAAAGQPAPVIDVLIVSGGGDWGAFGAGFLKGWLKYLPITHSPSPSSTRSRA